MATNELCDNGKQIGCLTCQNIDFGYSCKTVDGFPSVCSVSCGDSYVFGDEVCDNGKKPGCSNCNSVDSGWQCDKLVLPDGHYTSQCSLIPTSVCGDGILAINEQCEYNGTPVPGCDATTCKIKFGYSCDSSIPSVCQSVCGDGKLADNEFCDNHGAPGCKSDCTAG